MSLPADTPEADWHEAVLKELAELDLVAARDLQVRLLAAQDGAEAAALAHVLDRMSRSVRLTVALRARLARERARDGVEAQKVRAAAETTARQKIRSLVAAAIERRIAEEVESDTESELLLDELKEKLDLAEVLPGFAAEAVPVLIAKLSAELGFEPEADEVPQNPPPALDQVVAFGERSNLAPAADWPVKAFPPESS